MATLLTEQWVVRKDPSSPWEYHDVQLGTKPKLVRKGFELMGYGTSFEQHPVATLPKDVKGRIVLPGDSIVYMWGYRSKQLTEGVVSSLGKNCVYVDKVHTPTYTAHNRITSGKFVKV